KARALPGTRDIHFHHIVSPRDAERGTGKDQCLSPACRDAGTHHGAISGSGARTDGPETLDPGSKDNKPTLLPSGGRTARRPQPDGGGMACRERRSLPAIAISAPSAASCPSSTPDVPETPIQDETHQEKHMNVRGGDRYRN